MNLIVNVNEDWAIGAENELLNYIKGDMRLFRETTLDKIVIMGRKTLASFPNGEPLKNRANIVVTHNPSTLPPDCVGFSDMDKLLAYLSTLPSEDLWVIGGAQIYDSLLPYCKFAKVTKVQNHADNADTFFPNLDEFPSWDLVESSDILEEGDIKYRFTFYENQTPKNIISIHS